MYSTNKSDFDYVLPDEFIAKRPLAQRGDSKLLQWKKGVVSHHQFTDLAHLLDQPYSLVFNNTKVLPARMYFQRESGALIQVFLLHPFSPFDDMERSLKMKDGPAEWQCIIGNLKKWKDGETLTLFLHDDKYIRAKISNRASGLVRFEWNGAYSFAEAIEIVGKLPLPPYIDRIPDELDENRYQTVYALNRGAVAAPTAGLHFTDSILDELKSKGNNRLELTLHVGAGTFQPVKTEDVRSHHMHEEVILIDIPTIARLRDNGQKIAVGTTSVRALESLYWMGVQLEKGLKNWHVLGQFDHESLKTNLEFPESLDLIVRWMTENDVAFINGRTAIMITPGYQFKGIVGLITNFHLPQSTLIMLISAVVGEHWRKIYQEAKDQNYRFLSYGDSSLLWL
jgi:S-adenosylmethionine:tRNA ribosyltransferase-isomerase